MEELSFHLERVVRSREEYEDFSGPLDLILYLLSKNKIEIKDIQISLILDQYLEWMRVREELDLEVASDFVAMAAHLVWLKTRMLLSIDDAETREEMEKLIKSLEERSQMEEYKNMQLGAAYLGERSKIGSDIYVKAAEQLGKDNTYRYRHLAGELLSALEDVSRRRGEKAPPPISAFSGIVGREEYPVAQKLVSLAQILIFKPTIRFMELLHGCSGRSEVIATFLAVLEYCREGRAEIEDSPDGALVRAASGSSE